MKERAMIQTNNKMIFLLCVVCAMLFCSRATADFRKIWTPKDLRKQSDLIVIGTPKKSIETKETFNLLKDRGIDMDIIIVESTFKVTLSIKGDVEDDAEIVLIHYKMKSVRDKLIENPPLLVEFRTDTIIVSKEKTRKVLSAPDYLLYLTKRKDGKYECVSGHYYAGDSIFEVNNAWSDSSSILRADARPRGVDRHSSTYVIDHHKFSSGLEMSFLDQSTTAASKESQYIPLRDKRWPWPGR